MNERTSSSPTRSISGSQLGRSNCVRRPESVRGVDIAASLAVHPATKQPAVCDKTATSRRQGGENPRRSPRDAMTRHTQPSGVGELVDAMLEFTAPIAQILDHMARAPGRPEPGENLEILRGLLCDVLEPLATVLAARDLRT